MSKYISIIAKYASGERNFREANLSGTDLRGANLIGANLSRTDLSRANLREANLREANLSRANLSRANLIGANLSRANLSETDLSRANLSETDLSRANLSGTDLREANLSGANLREANLIGANLSRANLREANLIGANLSRANLSEADLPKFQIPGGALQGWKKLCQDYIAELTIPWEAKRTATPIGRKCRAEYAYVASIFTADGSPVSEGFGRHDNTLVYTVGTLVYPDSYDDDIRVECTHGIHFYLTREEAEAF